MCIRDRAQDVYGLESQKRTAAAQESGKFDAEIIPVTCSKAVTNKETGAVTFEEVTLRKDEGNRCLLYTSTAWLRALTGGLSMVMTPTVARFSKDTTSLMASPFDWRPVTSRGGPRESTHAPYPRAARLAGGAVGTLRARTSRR